MSGNYSTSHYETRSPLKPNDGIARAAQVLVGLATVLCLVNAVIRFDRASVIDERADMGTLVDADDRVLAGVLILALAMLTAGVVFIIWQFRHAQNGKLLGSRQGLGPGWAIGGWFVPCANSVLPAVQIFQSTKVGRDRRGASIVVAWGIAYGLANLVTSMAYFGQDTDSDGNVIVRSDADIDALARADRTAALGFLTLTVAGVLAIVMVGQLTRRQHEAWAARLQYQAAPQPGYPTAPRMGDEPRYPPGSTAARIAAEIGVDPNTGRPIEQSPSARPSDAGPAPSGWVPPGSDERVAPTTPPKAASPSVRPRPPAGRPRRVLRADRPADTSDG